MTTKLKSKCCEADVFATTGKTFSDTNIYWICQKCNQECAVQETSHEEKQFALSSDGAHFVCSKCLKENCICTEDTKTLRDKFAMQILPKFLGYYQIVPSTNETEASKEQRKKVIKFICDLAYEIADIAIETRKKNERD